MLSVNVVDAQRVALAVDATVMLRLLRETVPPARVLDTTGVVAAHAELVPAQNFTAISPPASVPVREIVMLVTEASTDPVFRTVMGLVTVWLVAV
tara:strand:+ start:1993 stop:2277 length:285 start_codon:yes stop_codon:yes gene_type:complete